MTHAGSCTYCNLPISGTSADDSGPHYCCFGCRFAAAVASESEAESAWPQRTLTRLGVAIFLTMNVMVFTMALWSEDLYGSGGADDPNPLAQTVQGLFRYLSLFFALPVLWLLGGPLFENARRGLRRGGGAMDLLLLFGVVAAFAYSVVSVLNDHGRIYFEVGCMVLVLVTLGRWIEAAGKQKTTEALTRLQKLLPATVRRLDDGRMVEVSLESVQAGDHLRVLPGERIPCDGQVRFQAAHVDEQLLSGESQLVEKAAGDPVWSGTVNVDADLIIEVTAAAREGALAQFIALVRRALASKGRYEQLAERVASLFLPAVIVAAVAAAVVHGLFSGVDAGVMAGLAVSLIACPCALGIATPLALWSAMGTAASAHLLFRDSTVLERLSQVRGMVFDKTGTLTTGQPCVEEVILAPKTDADLVRVAAATVAGGSSHPYSQAIRRTFSVAVAHVSVKSHSGRGVSAFVPQVGSTVWLGNQAHLEEHGQTLDACLKAAMEAALAEDRPIVLIGWGGRGRGLFVLHEELRPEATTALAALRHDGITVEVLTGDHPARAAALGRALALPALGGLRPEDKLRHLEAMRARVGPVGMIGDGLNDAPALAAADVGIAMGCGADLSRAAAGVCVLNDDLRKVPEVIRLARRTVATIRLNLFWALVYNIIGIGLAALGWLNPIFAAGAMVLSSLLVVGNSLRLRVEPRAEPNPVAADVTSMS